MSGNVIGVVMCGGQSSRMGSDKGMLMSDGMTWVKLAFNKFRDLGIPAIISVNESQIPAYKEIFPEDLLLSDCVAADGPLKGILSVHRNFPEQDIFLLACDMKDMGLEYLNVLYKSWQADNNSFDCFLFKNEGRYEPLAGVYTSRFLSEVYKLNLNRGITDYSLQSIVRNGKIFEVEVSAQMKHHFRNYNKPSDL